MAVFATWAYFGTLSAPWLFDDHELLERMGAWADNSVPWNGVFWKSLLASPRPLRQLTFWADSWLWVGGEAMRVAARVENLALHVGVAVLWGTLLVRMGRRHITAWGSAALFAVLPIHWETLGVVSHRKELLAAFFGLLGILGLGARQRHWKVFGLMSVMLAVFGKETAVVFPLLAVLMDRWRMNGETRSRAWHIGRTWVALALVTAMFSGMVVWGQTHWSMAHNIPSWDGRTGVAAEATSLWEGTRLGVQSFSRHVAAMAGWNTPCMERQKAPSDGGRGCVDLMISGLFCMAWALLAWRGWCKERAWGLAMAWVLVSLVMVSLPPLLANGAVKGVAGRYDYVPAMGFAWLIGEGIAGMPLSLGVCALATLVMGTSLVSHLHAPEFQSEKALWMATLKRNECSKLALFNLAQTFREEGDVWGGVRFLTEHIRELGRNPFAKGKGGGPVSVVVAGDSVPYGWNDTTPGLSLSLAARLRSRAESAGEGMGWLFSNWAEPGSRLSELPTLLKRRLSANRVEKCVMMSGHNDALDGTEVELMLEDAGNAALECLLGGAVPVWVSPVQVNSIEGQDRSNQATILAMFGRRLDEQCEQAGICYIDFVSFANKQEGGAGAWTEGGNGVHLNFAGMENLAGFIFHEGLKEQRLELPFANQTNTKHERTHK